MKPSLLFLLPVFLCLGLNGENVVTIGTGTNSQPSPFNLWHGYTRSAAIYTSAEIGISGVITTLGWEVIAGDIEICPIKIYLKLTTDGALYATSWENLKTGATLVYDASASFPSTGWKTIDIADFVYANAPGQNLLVLCEANYGGNGASSNPVFAFSPNPFMHESWQQHETPPTDPGVPDENRPNIQISCLALTTPNPPSGFIAHAVGTSQVNLAWKRNGALNNVMVAFNTVNTFGTPSGSYAAGNTISGGGTILYNGSAESYTHNAGLNPATTYYYKAWSVLPPTPAYSIGTGASATTFCTALSNFPDVTDFESLSFPPLCWSLAQKPWTYDGAVSANGNGTGSAYADFFNIQGGKSFDLISPVLNLTALVNPLVSFNHAYASYSGEVDVLELWVSDDAGATYSLVHTWLGGANGPLNTGGLLVTPFVPGAGEWASKSYPLPAGANRILFRGVSAWGNRLYLDNITIQGTCGPGSIPLAVITPSGPTAFCQGGSVMLTATGGTGYLWSNAATTASITVSSGGSYTVTVTNSSGCSDTESIPVTVNPLPIAVITPSCPTAFCQGGSVMLTATGGTGYLWSNLATTAAITVNSGGTFSVTVTTNFGCTGTGIILVTENLLLPVSVTISPSANPVSTGENVTLTAVPVNGGTMPSYEWKVNGTIVSGASGYSYSYTPVNNDTVSCMLMSNEICAAANPANSNTVILSVLNIPVNTSVSGIVTGGQIQCYNATQTITVGGNSTPFAILTGGNVTVIAGRNIIYLPGTTVEQGGSMHGYITTNNQFCNWQADAPASAIPVVKNDQVNLELTSFMIYPNPTSGNFILEERGRKEVIQFSMEVFNLRGESVYKGKSDRGRIFSCNIIDFPAGCYYVKVVAGNYLKVMKLIKSND